MVIAGSVWASFKLCGFLGKNTFLGPFDRLGGGFKALQTLIFSCFACLWDELCAEYFQALMALSRCLSWLWFLWTSVETF